MTQLTQPKTIQETKEHNNKEQPNTTKQERAPTPLLDHTDFEHRSIERKRRKPYTLRDCNALGEQSNCARNASIDGRDAGKTNENETIAQRRSVAALQRETSSTKAFEHHPFPEMNRIKKRFETKPKFANEKTEVTRTPRSSLRFKNGFIQREQIAGPPGINFQCLHIDCKIIDQAPEMNDSTWPQDRQVTIDGSSPWVNGFPKRQTETDYRMTCMPDSQHTRTTRNKSISNNFRERSGPDAKTVTTSARSRPGKATHSSRYHFPKERTDALLFEARQFEVGIDGVMDLVRNRDEEMKKNSEDRQG